MTDTGRRNALVGVVAVALLGAAYLAFRPRPAGPDGAAPASSSGAALAQAPAGLPPVGSAARPAPPPPPDDPRRQKVIADQVTAFLDHARFPPESRPPTESPPGEFNAASPGVKRSFGDGKPTVQQTQDHLYVTGGMTVVATLSVQVDGRAQTIEPPRADVVENSPDGTPGNVVAVAAFHDDGRGADAEGHDGTYTAEIELGKDALGDYVGQLWTSPKVHVGDEDLPIDFTFTATGVSPAIFTGTIDEKMDQGSLTLSVGVDVTTAGRYAFAGMVTDASGKPVARLEHMQKLESGRQTVPLLIFGKLVRDASAKTPLVVKSLEGWRFNDEGKPPERSVMQPLSREYRTRRYPLKSFSDAEWESAEKQATLDRLQGQLKN